MTETFQGHAPAIHCDGCANAITRSLGKLPGVQNVEVDVERKQVIVQYESGQLAEGALRKRLELAGFPVE